MLKSDKIKTRFLDWALLRKDLKKDEFELVVRESIKIHMKVN